MVEGEEMNTKVNDKVAFKRSDAKLKYPELWGVCCIDTLQSGGRDLRKGTVTRIKTHKWLFIKLKSSIYVIDDCYLVEKIKPIIRHSCG